MKRAIIYIQNNDKNDLDPWVLPTILSMAFLVDELHFVTSERLNQGCLDGLPANCYLYQSPTGEHRFLRWSRVINHMDFKTYGELILMHSDLVGSPASLVSFLDQKPEKADVWSLTACTKPEWHLQPDLLVLNRPAIRSKAFHDFFSHLLPLRDPGQVYRSYGIGLSVLLQEAGMILNARFSGFRLALRVAEDGIQGLWRLARVDDPLLAFGSHLLNLGCPFFHAEAIRSNPRWDDLRQLRREALRNGIPSSWLKTDAFPLLDTECCSMCGSSQVVIRHAGIPGAVTPPQQNLWNVHRCLHCQHHWTSPRPTEAQLSLAYANYYTHGVPPPDFYASPPQGLRGIVVNVLERFNRRILRVHNLREGIYRLRLPVGSGHLLEVGCGSGERLAYIRKLGWDVQGQEVDSRAADVSRERHGLEVLVGKLEELQLGEASYDVIVLNHVLEHLPEPSVTLREIHRLLKPGGRLLLATPNPQSLGHRCFQRFWHSLSLPYHLELFSKKSLKMVLRNSGFNKIRIRTTPANAEIIALHGRDLLADGKTDYQSTLSRLSVEPVPMAFQSLAILYWLVARGAGEECLAEASR